jgi:hypothetical protein
MDFLISKKNNLCSSFAIVAASAGMWMDSIVAYTKQVPSADHNISIGSIVYFFLHNNNLNTRASIQCSDNQQ